jgi:hypothetical protein
MMRLGILLGLILLCAGCATVADKAQWEEALRDFRGENMEMGSRSSAKN